MQGKWKVQKDLASVLLLVYLLVLVLILVATAWLNHFQLG